jgi:hypothetical protein
VSGINWFIDPYGMYWSPQIQGLNLKKVEAGDRGRTIKPKRIIEVMPETVLIGNSRIEMGFSSRSPLFSGQPVYNIGLPGISLGLQAKLAMSQLTDNPKLKTMLLSVDYLDYLFSPQTFAKPEDYLAQINTKQSHWQELKQQSFDYMSLLLSLDTLTSSAKTIAMQGSDANYIEQFGTNIADGYLSILRNEGVDVLFRQKLREVASRLIDSNQVLYGNDVKINPGFVWLSAIIAKAEEKHVNLIIFINPYHYSYLHQIDDSGHWLAFLEWKRGLANLVGKDDVIWDFSGFNEYTTENVNLSQPHLAMQWYWEPAHYNAKLGEKMLDIMMVSKEPNEFGRILDAAHITLILQADNIGLAATESSYLHLRKNLKLD